MDKGGQKEKINKYGALLSNTRKMAYCCLVICDLKK